LRPVAVDKRCCKTRWTEKTPPSKLAPNLTKAGGDMDAELESQILQLYETEGLSQRQIADQLGICRKRLRKIIKGQDGQRKKAAGIMTPYERLIREMYANCPTLKAIQVYERLKSYGFAGSYETVRDATFTLRAKKPVMYHELELLPGEEAQVDWMELKLPTGTVYGFVYILAWSRYLFVRFYPRMTLEFFLDGHIAAFRETLGVAHKNRYDNLKIVVIQRKPELKLNTQFLDFSRHYGFEIRLCTPYRANEKGRVERAIRDVRLFTSVHTFRDLRELNRMVETWRRERNGRIHRTTGKPPNEAILEEKLRPLPQFHYLPYRAIAAHVSKTGFVEFDGNRYSAPSRFCGAHCTITAYPDTIEIIINGLKTATHKRSFGKKEKMELPGHREGLLRVTPHHKLKRIYQLMKNMDEDICLFLKRTEEEGDDPLASAHRLFRMLRRSSKAMLLSAVREALKQESIRLTFVQNLLITPENSVIHPVQPQNRELMEISYEERGLAKYDEFI
jgi:transposase